MVRTFFAIAAAEDTGMPLGRDDRAVTGLRELLRLSALAAGILAGLGPATASAAYPGPNGAIHFSALAPGASVADVWAIDPRGGPPVNLTDLPGGPGQGHDPSASGDGSRLAFVVGEGATAEIWTMAADGSGPQPLSDNGVADLMPALSADGSKIAFASARGPDPADLDLWVMNADGSAAALLYAAPGDEQHPQFSADGEHLALATVAGGDLDIAYVPAAGGPHAAATVVTEYSDLDQSNPSIKPDGSRVAFSESAGGGPADIYDVFFNGTDFLAIAADPAADETAPAYSPDGTELAYVRNGTLVVAAAGGADPQPLDTAPALAPGDPDWAVGAALDRKPPQTTITRAPKRAPGGRAGFRFRSDEPGSSFACRLDRRAWRDCESPQRYRRLRAGGHSFRVRATDAAGNRDPSAARARFSVGGD
jgi:Tol biopolymer transport system component